MEKDVNETSPMNKDNVINLTERREENLIILLAEIVVDKALKQMKDEKSNYIPQNIYRQAK